MKANDRTVYCTEGIENLALPPFPMLAAVCLFCISTVFSLAGAGTNMAVVKTCRGTGTKAPLRLRPQAAGSGAPFARGMCLFHFETIFTITPRMVARISFTPWFINFTRTLSLFSPDAALVRCVAPIASFKLVEINNRTN